jgi:hypothetical protein
MAKKRKMDCFYRVRKALEHLRENDLRVISRDGRLYMQSLDTDFRGYPKINEFEYKPPKFEIDITTCSFGGADEETKWEDYAEDDAEED